MSDGKSKSISVGSDRSNPQAGAFEEARLVAAAQDGDLDAFGQLIRRYEDRVYNVIYRMIGRRELAEELAQETFLRAFKHLDRFRGGSTLYTWLFRIAVNLSLSHRRRVKKVAFVSMQAQDDDQDHARQWEDSRAETPEKTAMRSETRQRVAAAIAELDEPFKAALVLRDIEGMDYIAIGDVLDLSVGTVKSRIHRARLMLRDKLSDLIKP